MRLVAEVFGGKFILIDELPKKFKGKWTRPNRIGVCQVRTFDAQLTHKKCTFPSVSLRY